MENREQEISLDIREIFEILRKRIWLIITIVVVATLSSGLISFFVLKPVYQAKISIVIGSNNNGNNSDKTQIDYNDVMMYQNLIKTYAEIAQSRTVAQKTMDKLNLGSKITPELFSQQITVTPQANTQIMDLKVKDRNAVKAMDAVNALADSFIGEAKRIYPSGNIQIIDKAVVPKLPISPNKKLNIAIAFLLGLIISVGLSLLMEYLDNTIKTEMDVEKYLELPVIGIIPKSQE